MDYIPLSTLNDFIFCPYSIYLHSVYMESDDEVYKALPQTKGKLAHAGVDSKSGSTQRKSLICDLIEPFRCIIDHATLLAFNRKQFSEKDFILLKNEYRLKNEHCAEYYNVYYEALIKYKADFFNYVQQYYRCFMGRKSVQEYPKFQF